MVYEYMLIKEMDKMRAPSWVEDGGYFRDPDTFTMIGWSPDEGVREYYIPDTVVELSKAQLADRLLDIHARYPMKKRGENPTDEETVMTDAEVQAISDAWYESKNS